MFKVNRITYIKFQLIITFARRNKLCFFFIKFDSTLYLTSLVLIQEKIFGLQACLGLALTKSVFINSPAVIK